MPSADIVFSFPTVSDDFHRNPKSIYTIRKLSELLANTNSQGIYHNNINKDCLGKGKLHLNGKGLGRLAKYFAPRTNDTSWSKIGNRICDSLCLPILYDLFEKPVDCINVHDDTTCYIIMHHVLCYLISLFYSPFINVMLSTQILTHIHILP